MSASFFSFHILVHFILIKPIREVLFLFYLQMGETKVQRGYTTCPKAHSLKVTKSGVEPGKTGAKVLSLFF